MPPAADVPPTRGLLPLPPVSPAMPNTNANGAVGSVARKKKSLERGYHEAMKISSVVTMQQRAVGTARSREGTGKLSTSREDSLAK
ncbi:hypothetical protein HPP92_001058 [Vanilla planifolia]|uniref:Uncharacterized protein n=1 Tax=Vanilla planifolia TaxID=51239 RepID=A0A835VF37_VANPL|nr:hypothetical protein HPP92_001168 [Vanilla planifolia]KAG0500986.1 hypothetical protein HPP92_001058 [Vanilla planifolia]